MNRFLGQVHYARQALANCLIRIGDSPAWIGEIGDGYSCEIYYPMNGKTSIIPDLREVKDLNMAPVPLGYVNNVKSCQYIKRVPRRRWKQGLNPQSVDVIISEEGLKSKAFGNTILGRFPSAEKASELIISRKKRSVAFSREWALQVGMVEPTLLHRGTAVGIYKDGEACIFEKYQYLTESFKEAA